MQINSKDVMDLRKNGKSKCVSTFSGLRNPALKVLDFMSSRVLLACKPLYHRKRLSDESFLYSHVAI